MKSYDNIRLDKYLYSVGESFTHALESIDPSEQYIGTSLEGLDAYQRQLKRFDIKVWGGNSDIVDKFFRTPDSAILFPEYVARAVRKGFEERDDVSKIVATTTLVNSLDYRSVSVHFENEEEKPIPGAEILTTNGLVRLKKQGRILSTSYKMIRHQRIELFTIALKQIGAYIAHAQMASALDVISENACETRLGGENVSVDINHLESLLVPYTMTTILAGGMTHSGLLRDNKYPLKAEELICSPHIKDWSVIALDRNYALERVQAGGITLDEEKLIDKNFENTSITITSGFNKIFNQAVVVGKIGSKGG